MTSQPAQRSGGPVQPAGGHLFLWGLVGVLGLIIFNAGWLIAETWQGPSYSPIADTISDMQAQTAPHVWFPIACFALGALGGFGFAMFGLRPALAGASKVAANAPVLLAFSLLALGNSFPLIPCRLSDAGCTASVQLASPGGLTDAIVAGIAFFILAFLPYPLWHRVELLDGWRPLKPVMFAARVICPVAWILLAVSSNLSGMPAVGLIERVLAASCSLWVGALALTLTIESRHTGSAERSAASVPS
jgi:Protein of unknown function (DUF998)